MEKAEKECKCVDEVNKDLQGIKEFEGVYIRNTTNLKTREKKATVALERRAGKGKFPPLIASFCPFCGVKY